MRFLASSHRIDQLTRRTRILLALLVLGLLGQLVTGGLMQHLGGGWTPGSIASYYRGDAPDAVEQDPMAAFGSLGI